MIRILKVKLNLEEFVICIYERIISEVVFPLPISESGNLNVSALEEVCSDSGGLKTLDYCQNTNFNPYPAEPGYTLHLQTV